MIFSFPILLPINGAMLENVIKTLNAVPQTPATFATTDPVDRLPQTARAKLTALQERVNLLRLGVVDIADRLNEAVRAGVEARNRIDQVQHKVDETHPSVKQAIEKRDRAKAEYARLDLLHAERAKPLHELGGLLNNLERWISEQRDLVAFNGPVPPIGRAAPAKVVENAREELERLRAELERVRRAPIPAKEAKALAAKHVEQLASRGAPDVSGLLEADVFGKREIGYATERVDMSRMPAGLGGSTIDVRGLLAWLDPAKYLARLEEEIDRRADDVHALPDDQRATRLRQLAAEILDVERLEEAAIEAAELAGVQIIRRVDADPRAVLGLSSDLPAPQVD
ncbi:MAG TPA: hypothetical protein VHD14_00570 [Pseudolabrys sp.]|nr:hypothetical protein [Pseudolabrys sp.]